MRAILVTVLVLGTSCGGETPKMAPPPPVMNPPPMLPPPASDPGPTPAQIAAAMEGCMTFVSTMCGRYADCTDGVQGVPPHAQRIADCKSLVATSIDCGKAVGLAESYLRCIREINESSCTVFYNPQTGELRTPASCMGVILVAQ